MLKMMKSAPVSAALRVRGTVYFHLLFAARSRPILVQDDPETVVQHSLVEVEADLARIARPGRGRR